jgi:hypothetical protein
VNVDVNVGVVAFSVPRVFAAFNLSVHGHACSPFSDLSAYKTLGATAIHEVERAE